MTTTLTIDVPANEWMTANGRLHWSQRARRTKALRFRARMLARSQQVPHYVGRVRVDFEVSTRTAGRFDPGNAYPTVKAIVDGLTDAGVWDDDDSEHLEGPVPHRGPVDPALPVGAHRITLTITGDEDQ